MNQTARAALAQRWEGGQRRRQGSLAFAQIYASPRPPPFSLWRAFQIITAAQDADLRRGGD